MGAPPTLEMHLQRLDLRLQRLEAHLQRLDLHLQRLEARPQRLDARPQRLEVRLQRLDVRLQRLEVRLEALEFHPRQPEGRRSPENLPDEGMVVSRRVCAMMNIEWKHSFRLRFDHHSWPGKKSNHALSFMQHLLPGSGRRKPTRRRRRAAVLLCNFSPDALTCRQLCRKLRTSKNISPPAN